MVLCGGGVLVIKILVQNWLLKIDYQLWYGSVSRERERERQYYTVSLVQYNHSLADPLSCCCCAEACDEF